MSLDRGGKHFQLELWCKSGVSRPKDRLPPGAEALEEKTACVRRVGELVGNEIEKSWEEKKHNHESQLHSITPNDRLSMAVFKKHQR